MQTDSMIYDGDYTISKEATEPEEPKLTATCTATKILVLQSEALLDVLDESFFLHEF